MKTIFMVDQDFSSLLKRDGVLFKAVPVIRADGSKNQTCYEYVSQKTGRKVRAIETIMLAGCDGFTSETVMREIK
jgi:hypothetical protein